MKQKHVVIISSSEAEELREHNIAAVWGFFL